MTRALKLLFTSIAPGSIAMAPAAGRTGQLVEPVVPLLGRVSFNDVLPGRYDGVKQRGGFRLRGVEGLEPLSIGGPDRVGLTFEVNCRSLSTGDNEGLAVASVLLKGSRPPPPREGLAQGGLASFSYLMSLLSGPVRVRH